MVLDTAQKIMAIVVPFPPGYKSPEDLRQADCDRARFIFQKHPNLMAVRGFNSAEALVEKFWNDPIGQLPLGAHEI
jgi:hypothetical protein